LRHPQALLQHLEAISGKAPESWATAVLDFLLIDADELRSPSFARRQGLGTSAV